ncbi:unnamed protein product [Blepharisma stoltei]|uniref:Uncharacterized protein n=1 Tax=Blepharisma stoltei TaxID=1481888 RepID=A0AAU9JT12_9CILI|nr:unnamed protein product [Blepharisma stoltei]
MAKRRIYNKKPSAIKNNQAKARMKVIHELLKEDSQNGNLKAIVSKGIIDLHEGERNNLQQIYYKKNDPVINLD